MEEQTFNAANAADRFRAFLQKATNIKNVAAIEKELSTMQKKWILSTTAERLFKDR